MRISLLVAMFGSCLMVTAAPGLLPDRRGDSALFSGSSLEDIVGDAQPVSDYWQLKSLSAVADMDLVGTVETIKKALASDAVVQASSKSSDLRGGDTTLGELKGFRAGGASPVRRQKGLDGEHRTGERTRRWEAGKRDEVWGNREKRDREQEANDYGAGLKRTEGTLLQGYPLNQASM